MRFSRFLVTVGIPILIALPCAYALIRFTPIGSILQPPGHTSNATVNTPTSILAGHDNDAKGYMEDPANVNGAGPNSEPDILQESMSNSGSVLGHAQVDQPVLDPTHGSVLGHDVSVTQNLSVVNGEYVDNIDVTSVVGVADVADAAGVADAADIAGAANSADAAGVAGAANSADAAGVAGAANSADAAGVVDVANSADAAGVADVANVAGAVGVVDVIDTICFTLNGAPLFIEESKSTVIFINGRYYIDPVAFVNAIGTVITGADANPDSNQPSYATADSNLPSSAAPDYNTPSPAATDYNAPSSATTGCNLPSSTTTEYNLPSPTTTKYHKTLNNGYASLYDLCAAYNLETFWDADASTINLFSGYMRPTPKDIPRDNNTGLIRLEDIAAFGGIYSVEKDLINLRVIADYLYSEGVIYAVAWVPRFVVPDDNYDNDLANDYSMYNTEFVFTMDFMIDRGAEIGLHGYTHQTGKQRSIAGYEFADNANNTVAATRERIEMALSSAEKLGFPIKFFEFPHYAGTELQFGVAEEMFDVIYNHPYKKWPSRVYSVTRGDRQVKYIHAGLDCVNSFDDVDNMVNKIRNLGKTSLAALYYHVHFEYGFIIANITQDGKALTISFDAGSPIHRIVDAMHGTGRSFASVNDF